MMQMPKATQRVGALKTDESLRKLDGRAAAETSCEDRCATVRPRGHDLQPGQSKEEKKRSKGESVMRLERQFYALASVVRWDGWHG